MTEPRQIAVVRAHEGYSGIVAAFRKRKEELNASCVVLNEIAGLTPGHLAKILAEIKSLGPESWGPTLGCHGMAIAFIEDPDAMRQIASRLTPRNGSQVRVHNPAVHLKFSIRKLKQMGRKGGANSRKNMSRKKRRSLARKAARARWHKPKVVEVKPVPVSDAGASD